jgi:hypothetical protein
MVKYFLAVMIMCNAAAQARRHQDMLDKYTEEVSLEGK